MFLFVFFFTFEYSRFQYFFSSKRPQKHSSNKNTETLRIFIAVTTEALLLCLSVFTLLCGFFKVWDQRQLKLATRDQDEKINHWQDCKMSGVSNLD